MDDFFGIAFAVVGVIVFGAMIGILMAFPVMWCWNYAVVAVWKLPAITWGQAWCLYFLAGCFIKSTLSCSK